MIASEKKCHSKGFSLVELLVVMVIMGLVITSVYGLFVGSNKTANTSEEVVDVQQNLRVAMETLVADIRMAGFLIPSTEIPVETTPASLAVGAVLDLNIVTSTGVYARVTGVSATPIPTTGGTLTVDDGMAINFNSVHGLRIVEPSNPSNFTNIPIAEFIGSDGAANTLTIKPGAAVTVNPNDMVMLIKADDATSIPVLVSYQLVDDTDSSDANMFLLQRTVGGGASQTVAANINTVEFAYVPSATDIKAIRITITASTDSTKTGLANYSGVKTRSLQTLVKIQNTAED